MWEKSYGREEVDHVTELIKTNDQQHVMYGHTHRDVKYYPGETYLHVTRIDTNGQYVWQHHFTFDGLVKAGDLIRSHDGGYIITATLRQPDRYQNLVWKLNEAGKPIWKKTFDGKQGHAPWLAARASDSAFFITGKPTIDSRYNEQNLKWSDKGLFVLKLNNQGELEHKNNLGYEKIIEPISLNRIDRSTYSILATRSHRIFQVTADYIEGQLLPDQVKPLNLPNGDYQNLEVNAIHQTPDNQWLLGGAVYEKNRKSGPHGWLSQIDKTGELQWQAVYEHEEANAIHAIAWFPDLGLVFGGHSGRDRGSIDLEEQNFWIGGTNFSGELQWEQFYGGEKPDEVVDLSLMPATGEYFALGITQSRPKNANHAIDQQAFHLLKFDTNGFKQSKAIKAFQPYSEDTTYTSMVQLTQNIHSQPSNRALNKLLYRHRLIANPTSTTYTDPASTTHWRYRTDELKIDTFSKNLFKDQQPELVLQLRSKRTHDIAVFYQDEGRLKKVPGRISNQFSKRYPDFDFVFYFKEIGKPNTYEIATKRQWEYSRSNNEEVRFYDIIPDTIRQFYGVETKSYSYSGLRTYTYDTEREIEFQLKANFPKQLMIHAETNNETDMERNQRGTILSGKRKQVTAKKVVTFVNTSRGLKISQIQKNINKNIKILGIDNN